MSNNIPKKLALKAELLRRLTTAQDHKAEGRSSSGLRVMILEMEITAIDRFL